MHAIRRIMTSVLVVILLSASAFPSVARDESGSYGPHGDAGNSGMRPGSLPEGESGVLWMVRASDFDDLDEDQGAIRLLGVSSHRVILRYTSPTSPGYLIALDEVSGQEAWQYQLDGGIADPFADVLITENHIIVWTEFSLVVLLSSTGQVLWQDENAEGNGSDAMLVASDSLIITGNIPDAPSVRVVTLSTGKTKWTATISADYVGFPTVVGRTLAVLSGDRSEDNSVEIASLHGFDLEAGGETFRIGLESFDPHFGMEVNGNLVLAGRRDNGTTGLIAYDTATALKVWDASGCNGSFYYYVVDGGDIFCLAEGDISGVYVFVMTMDRTEFREVGETRGFPTGYIVEHSLPTMDLDRNTIATYDMRSLETTWTYSLDFLPPVDIVEGYVVGSLEFGEGVAFVQPPANRDDPSLNTIFAIAGSEGENALEIPERPRTALVSGGTAVVREAASLRAAPSTTGLVVAEIPADTVLELTGESETVDGVEWWPVLITEASEAQDLEGEAGYVEAQFLQVVASLDDLWPDEDESGD